MNSKYLSQLRYLKEKLYLIIIIRVIIVLIVQLIIRTKIMMDKRSHGKIE